MTTSCSPATPGLPLDGDALSSRYRDALMRAGLRPSRFHALRHTFGTRIIAKADIRRVQEWMGHADIQTTPKYLHYPARQEDAELVAAAFAAPVAAATTGTMRSGGAVGVAGVDRDGL
jgi:integrase